MYVVIRKFGNVRSVPEVGPAQDLLIFSGPCLVPGPDLL
jgi:hypothetical protein